MNMIFMDDDMKKGIKKGKKYTRADWPVGRYMYRTKLGMQLCVHDIDGKNKYGPYMLIFRLTDDWREIPRYHPQTFYKPFIYFYCIIIIRQEYKLLPVLLSVKLWEARREANVENNNQGRCHT